MANRRFQRSQSLEREVKQLHIEWTQVAGLPVIDKAMGIEKVERTAAGDFKITLQDKYNKLMSIAGAVKSTTAKAHTIQLKTEAVNTTKEIEVYAFKVFGGNVVDPSDGDSVMITLWLKNTSVVN